MKKLAVSTVIGYVLLVSIGLILSMITFLWMKSYTTFLPTEGCEEHTTVRIESYSCRNGELNLTLFNNGRFDVNGFIMYVGNDPSKEPIDQLVLKPQQGVTETKKAYYLFSVPLSPRESRSILFKPTIYTKTNKQPLSNYELKKIELKPFIIRDGDIIVCTDSKIQEKIENCILNS